MPLSDAKEIEWANHLLDEWKYRHEGFWKTLYRFLSAIAVLVTIPFVRADFLKPIRGRGIGLWRPWPLMYTSLPFIIFVAMCLLLASDYAKLKQVQRQVEGVRGRHQPDPPDELEAFRPGRRRIVSLSFIIIGFLLLLLWAGAVLNMRGVV